MISSAIKAKRESKGWSKKYLADLIGVSSAAIGQYEKGDNRPKVEVLLKLNKVFEYDFINGKEIENTGELIAKVKNDKNITNDYSGNNQQAKDELTNSYKLHSPETPPFYHALPIKEKSPPDDNNWKQLYFLQQEELNILNKKIALLNQIIQQ